MTFSNKKFLLITIIFSFSCSNLPNEVYIDALKPIYQTIIPSNTLEDYESEYSSAYVQIGNLEAVLVLERVLSDGRTYRWVGKDQVIIDTIDGKIVKTQGLNKNIEIKALSDSHMSHQSEDILYISNFFNPELFSINAKSVITREIIDNQIIIKETVFHRSIDFKASNKYLVDDSGRVLYTEQKIHPYLKKIRMDFRY